MRKMILSLFLTFTVAALQVPGSLAQAPSPNPKDPKYQTKGEQDRTYIFPGTGETIPYHIYVPSKWNKNTKLPLVVVTHGAAQAANMPFIRGERGLPKIAEERGYIIVGVTGYKASATPVAGGFNVPWKMVPAPRPANAGEAARGGGAGERGAPAAAGSGRGEPQTPPTAEDFRRSEQDVLYVTDLVSKEYHVDTNRVYLMGNSIGGAAVWYFGQKYPKRWTALAPSASPVSPEEFPYDRLKNLPMLVIHGDQDTAMSFDASKLMVEHAKAHGVDATFLPVIGGTHTEAWTKVLPAIFDFFEKHKTKKK